MAKGSNTRSGLLWEVERLLKECKELPQILLMENVPQVLNCDFGGWLEFLESKGYHNYYKCLNAKNYGIPQNRNRCFMVSVLGNYYYDFPKEIPLKLRLKDMLEEKVDEKYYIKNAKANTLLKGLDYENADKVCCDMTINQPRFRDIANTIKARYDCGIENRKQTETAVIEPKCQVVAQLDGSFESTGRIYGTDGLCPTINTMGGGQREPKIVERSNIKNIMTKIASTLGTNCGSSTSAGGGVVIEPTIIDDIYKNREPREYGDTAPTLRTNCQGLKVIEPKTNERFFRQAIEVVGNYSPSGHEASRIVHPEGVSPTIKENHGTVTATVEPNLRIRKLTPKECWRLMGFTDSDFDKAKASGVSNSQLYKQAGNSIVVNVLEEIFKKLF